MDEGGLLQHRDGYLLRFPDCFRWANGLLVADRHSQPSQLHRRSAGTVTDVGSYTGSASPNWTFDQGGNVWEWTDDLKTGALRRFRGGGWDNGAGLLQSGNHTGSFQGGTSDQAVGFRIVTIPEPGTALLVMTGLLGLAYRQRRHGRAADGTHP